MTAAPLTLTQSLDNLERIINERVAELTRERDEARAECERMRKVCERAAVVHKYAPFDPAVGIPPGYWQDINWLGDAVGAYRAHPSPRDDEDK